MKEIDLYYSTPPYHYQIEKPTRKKISNLKIIRFLFFLFGYVIAEPIVISKSKYGRKRKYSRATILLRGGNLENFIGRDHCWARQTKKETYFPVEKARTLTHNGMWCWKLEELEHYHKGTAVVLGKMKKLLFV